LATEAEVKAQIVRTAIECDKPKIEKTITTFKPEDIPSIVNTVKIGATSSDLPSIVVRDFEEQLAKNPNWNGKNIGEMSTEYSFLELYQIKSKPSLFLKRLICQHKLIVL